MQAFVLSATFAIAVSFGIARYGFGLFLPDMARSFALTKAELGLISSGAYAGYFSASLIAMTFTARLGARGMLVCGMALASLGMGLIASASTTALLIAGCILAGASPGLVFSPVSDAISALYDKRERGPIFSTVNAGDGLGAIVSAVVFFAVLGTWQSAWFVFACFGLASVFWIYATAPRESVNKGQRFILPSVAMLHGGAAQRLLAGSLVLGITTTVFWTFAAALVAERSVVIAALSVELRILLWLVLGAAGMAGVVAAPLLRRYGLRSTYATSVLLTALALCLSGWATESIPALLFAAAGFGLAYIMATSQLGAWALEVYAATPSTGFGLTFLVFGIGAIIGPALAGFAAEQIGLPATFVASGAVTAALMLFRPARLAAS